MTNLEMFYFLGKCLSIDEHPEFREVIIKRISDDELDWAHFVHLCSNHYILPVIYLKFKSHNLIEHLPEELVEFLREIYDRNLERNEQILLQINDILRLLNANDIYPTFLKGTGNLLDGLYSDKGERMIGDIDFLVPEKDFLKAAKLLEEDGYIKDTDFWTDLKSPVHYPPLYKMGVPVDVEVHRLLVLKQFGKKFTPESIDRKKIFFDENVFFFVLTDQHNASFNFIHSQLSHHGDVDGIVSLRNIYDLYLISKRIAIPNIINNIQYKNKAIAYFVFAGKVLDLPNRFCTFENYASKVFILKHSLNYNSQAFYKTYKIILFFRTRLFQVFFKMIFQSVYSRQVRIVVVNRLSKREWYRNHFNDLYNFFRANR